MIDGSYRWRDTRLHQGSKKIPDHHNFWHVLVWLHQKGSSGLQALLNTSMLLYDAHTTRSGIFMLMAMQTLTCYEERISFLRRWRREWWWWWRWPSPLVLDWQPWGLGEVGGNWSRRMLLKVWRALFNKAELRLRLPSRNSPIACYNFFLLKIQLLYEFPFIICTNWQPLLSHSFTMEEILNPSAVS